MTKNYGIHKDSTVIVKRNGKEFPIKITDVVKGDYIKGYDRDNNNDCWNVVLEIENISLPEKDHMRFWYKQEPFKMALLICGEGQEFDYWDYGTEKWEYKLGKELMSADKLKGTVENCEVHSADIEYCTHMEDGFIMFILSNSHNFYVRVHEPSEDERNKQLQASKEGQPVPKTIGYGDKIFEDYILVRGLKS